MNLFIDTNIFVRFYETSSESLVELEKLVALLRSKQATLWLPDQVQKEFWNHRERSIENNLAAFEKGSLMVSVPLLVKEDAEFGNLSELASALEKKRAEIVSRVRKEVEEENTRADRLVKQLFGLSVKIETRGAIFAQARERALRHLPPGKGEGVGDRICWEALLSAIPEKQDLCIISDDGDFESESVNEQVGSYLRHEWKTKKSGTISLWKRASKFLVKQFPDAANAVQLEHSLFIERLEKSASFADTHRIMAESHELGNIPLPLVQRLGQALTNNSQVYWILGDADVKPFAKDFLGRYEKNLDPETKEKIAGKIL